MENVINDLGIIFAPIIFVAILFILSSLYYYFRERKGIIGFIVNLIEYIFHHIKYIIIGIIVLIIIITIIIGMINPQPIRRLSNFR